MVLEFFVWWYGRGWLEAWRSARGWVNKVQMEFSASILLKTLFSPWKQIVALPGQSPGDKFRAMIDNLISRFIGFFVRLFVLITAVVLMVLVAVLGLIMLVAWPFIPLAVVYLIFRSIKG